MPTGNRRNDWPRKSREWSKLGKVSRYDRLLTRHKGTSQPMNKSQLNLQDTFLNQARKENIGVTIYLVNSVQLRGNVRGFDAFTILLDSPGKATQLIYKHAVTSIVPMRPMQNLYAEAMRDAGIAGDCRTTPERPAPRPRPSPPPARPTRTPPSPWTRPAPPRLPPCPKPPTWNRSPDGSCYGRGMKRLRHAPPPSIHGRDDALHENARHRQRLRHGQLPRPGRPRRRPGGAGSVLRS